MKPVTFMWAGSTGNLRLQPATTRPAGWSSRFSVPRPGGITCIELLVVIGVVAVLFALLMPATWHCHDSAPRITCINNLKQIGLAFGIFAEDHHGKFPMEVPTRDGGTKELVDFGLVVPHLLVMSNELSTPKLLTCPSDLRKATSDFGELRDWNISYFVGLDASQTNPQSLLAGDRNITNGSSNKHRILFLTTNQPTGWTKEIHERAGDLALSDGSVQQVSSARLQQLLLNSGVATNRLAIP